jgi:hypothetical protein
MTQQVMILLPCRGELRSISALAAEIPRDADEVAATPGHRRTPENR